MTNKIIKHIEHLIEVHKDDNLCTSCDWYLNTISEDDKIGFFGAYELGRYETLISLLDDLKRI